MRGQWSRERRLLPQPVEIVALRFLTAALRPEDAAHDLDDDEGDEPAEQHVAEIVAAEGAPQEAPPEAESKRSGHRSAAPGRGEHACRCDHPEAGRRFAGDERTVLLAAAIVVIPGYERVRPVEVLRLDGTGAMPMILEAEVDDEARPDDHRGDEKDHRAAARRPAEPAPEAVGEPHRRIGREHDERRHPEKVAAEALEVVTSEKASAVIEIARALEVELGPKGEDDKRKRGEHNVSGKCFVHGSRSDHAIGLATLGTFDAAAEGAGGAGDWHGIVTAKERPEVRHGFLKYSWAHRVDADARGHFDRGRHRERLDRRIDHAGGRTPNDRRA